MKYDIATDEKISYCSCCGEEMEPGSTSCCSDDFHEPGDERETGK